MEIRSEKLLETLREDVKYLKKQEETDIIPRTRVLNHLRIRVKARVNKLKEQGYEITEKDKKEIKKAIRKTLFQEVK